MMNFPFPTLKSELDPIVITSPTVRSGTTLLQRLLCSSTNSLIFGENCGYDLTLFLGIYTTKALMYNPHKENNAAFFKRVISGDTNDFMIDLMPDIDGYMRALGEACFSGISYCRDYSISVERPIWGFKYPGWRPQTIHMIREMMPNCRLIYIYRDVVECLKSAKASQIVRTEQEFHEFCRLWVENLSYALDLKGAPGVLLVNYRQMIEQPGETLAEIERFTGTVGIKFEVLEKKINRWSDATNTDYLEPAKLSEKEMVVVDETASHLRREILPEITA